MLDTELQRRERERRPIRVGMIGAGATGRAIALQLGTPVPEFASPESPTERRPMPSARFERRASRTGRTRTRAASPQTAFGAACRC